MTRKLTWAGMVIGSTIGGFVPSLWGGDLLSLSSLLFSLIGGLVGIYVGYRLAQSL